MKKNLPLLLLILLSACVAETVERRRPRKGPIKEVGFVDPGGGTVRYSVEGWGWFVAGRRRDALRRIRRNCGKQLAPQITDEYRRNDADIAYAGEDIAVNLDKGMDHFKIAPFQHIVYECRPKGAPPETPAVSTAPARAFLVVPPTAEVSTTTVIEPPVLSTATVPQEPQ
ncbi:MAG: hypothetical protein Q8T11_11860 [Elusimicrobiota bacterium]|nr:hypothetical protein [Elusimicrobiota bacterium]